MRYGFEQWNECLAAAIAAARSPDFPARVEAALAALIHFDIIMVFAYSGAARPSCVYHNMSAERAETVNATYSQGPYLLDPFYHAAVKLKVVGVRRLRDLVPDKFGTSEYYRQHYIRTRIRDEVGFFFRPRPDLAVVLSVTRPVGEPPFSTGDMRTIRAVEPVVRTLCESYWREAGVRDIPDAGREETDPINRALDEIARNRLTAREIEITSLILRGHSNASIAKLLRIAAGTVKIHRKNIYQKLALSSQAELFSSVIDRLRKY